MDGAVTIWMKRILVNVDRCSGCRLCELACSFTHEKMFEPSASRITVLKEDSLGLDLPIMCWHCRRCPAMGNCPSKALRRNSEGTIYVDESRCVGCGKCAEACPFGAIKLHPRKHTPLICNLCNGKPLCTLRCPTKALTYGETRMQRPKLPKEIFEETLRKWRIVA
jgi:Fe-S-cluster-containing hydrogenase component 2